jgi:hypothetical protein
MEKVIRIANNVDNENIKKIEELLLSIYYTIVTFWNSPRIYSLIENYEKISNHQISVDNEIRSLKSLIIKLNLDTKTAERFKTTADILMEILLIQSDIYTLKLGRRVDNRIEINGADLNAMMYIYGEVQRKYESFFVNGENHMIVQLAFKMLKESLSKLFRLMAGCYTMSGFSRL